jgi:hypothetical protein
LLRRIGLLWWVRLLRRVSLLRWVRLLWWVRLLCHGGLLLLEIGNLRVLGSFLLLPLGGTPCRGTPYRVASSTNGGSPQQWAANSPSHHTGPPLLDL